MLLPIFYALIISLLFIFIALPSIALIFKRIDFDLIIISIILGLVIQITIASWLVSFASLNESFWTFQSVILIATYYLLITKKPNIKLSLQISTSKIPIFSSLVSTTLFSFLFSDKFFGSKIAMRNGPDLIGWISSSRYFCRHESLLDLETQITSNLKILSVLDAFRNPITHSETSVYRLASVTTQVNGEFLIGAHRIGLPGLQGQFCQIVGENDLLPLVSAFALIAIFVSSYICGMIIRDRNIKKIYKFLIPILAIMNVNSVSVYLEGGYGQLLATPFLLYGVYSFTQSNKDKSHIGFCSSLIILFSLGTYFDLLIIFGFFVFVLWICKLLFIKMNILKSFNKFDIKLVGMSLFLGIPGLMHAPRLLLDRLGSGTYGGWDQGRIPTPANFFGLVNWLPPNGFMNNPRSISTKIIEVLISIIIIGFLWKNRSNNQMQPILAVFLIYLIVMFNTYSNGREGSNNYIVWKAAAYFSMLFILFAVTGNESREYTKNKSLKIIFSRLVVFASLILTTMSSLAWTDTWIKTRQLNFNEPDKKMREIIDDYDLVMHGFEGAGSYKFLLLGDVHFLAESRGFSVSSLRSEPSREIAFVLPKNCMNLDCELKKLSLDASRKFRIIYSNEEYTIYA